MTPAVDSAKIPSTVLAISSQVMRGSVGLSVIVPALLGRGHRVWPMPSIVLSNHPGHTTTATATTTPEQLWAMFEALHGNGWLPEVDAVLTGYLPTRAHVEFAAGVVKRVRAVERNAPRVHYLCDPVLGDDPKGLYIDPDAASAIRDLLLPLADTITPNRFELSWLTGQPVDSIASAVTAARHLAVPTVVATSVPADKFELADVAVTPHDFECAKVNKILGVPHGTGDLFGALYLSGVLRFSSIQRALAGASSGVASVITESHGRDELNLLAL
jgi:pyridoxine kinase